jgi:phage shock protein C
MNSRLYRSPDDRVLAGVAGGMAETYDLDPALVRVGWALLILFTGGVFLVLYIIMALVVPLRPMGMPLWAPGPMAPGATAEGGAPLAGSVPPDPGVAPTGTPGAYPYKHRTERRSDAGGALVIGMILIIVGAFFLARQYIPALNFNLIWPFVIIIGGVLLIFFAFIRPRRDS